MRVAKETDRAAWVESIEAAQDAEVAMTPRRPVSITRTHTLPHHICLSKSVFLLNLPPFPRYNCRKVSNGVLDGRVMGRMQPPNPAW